MPYFPQTFRQYVLKNPFNRRYLKIAAVAIAVQLVIFKLLYPYGDFFSDSYSYIYAAIMKQEVSLWPIGYTLFLRAFHVISHSDTALVVFQYVLVQSAALYLFFTVSYWLQPGEQTRKVMFYVLLFNPLVLYICNYISSDGLFLALSLCWFAQLLWLLYRPSWPLLLAHTILITIAFTVRYNAMYYPLITALVLLRCPQKIPFKILGIAAPLLLIAGFIRFTEQAARKVTGTAQFSVFGGWQVANNALYMFPYLKEYPEPPAGCESFHREVVHFFRDIVPKGSGIPSPIDGAIYLKHPNAPLKKYMALTYGPKDDTTGGIQSWGMVSPVYAKYGSYMVRQHPFYFSRYFLLPNTLNYFIPPLEKLSEYNLGSYDVSSIAVHWFHYPSKQLRSIPAVGAQRALLFFFPFIFGLMNLLLLGLMVKWFVSAARKTASRPYRDSQLLVFITLLVNAGFGILASPIVFRYQVFPMIVCFLFIAVLIDKLKPELQ
ncbi:hypothetical protein HF324_16690 [Chitinophaga oryzae]|uniref:Uncharacterized protein n=1 Tax=Chitinophaga oryzae TaxID=2725414 RepID=A0AAE7D816_9BACT|nr:hypothetical protein [Chitinophaga oryzae]QJB32942.1 hypothetical protein HF329_17105 [Chitinophaga oryzae]QJB39406.1 hypothetical protein HF324_16690 [Chitinophaga oryzae]